MLYTKSMFAALMAAVADAVPYPLSAASAVQPVNSTVNFGHKSGNFQPTKTVSLNGVHVDATGGQVTNGNVAVTSIVNTDGAGAGSDTYKTYYGDGTTGQGWPSKSKWVSFVDMFNANKAIMTGSCSQYHEANDSGPEIGAIYDSIQTVATETRVDHRFILAVIIQESGGCVRVPTSNYGVRNPGLMQDHNGGATCNSDITGKVSNPCPTATVTEMIREGSAGTSDGDGLAQCINESGAGDVSAFYKAARIYNSGSIDPSGALQSGIATHCYSSDIANRLTGWVNAPHTCPFDG